MFRVFPGFVPPGLLLPFSPKLNLVPFKTEPVNLYQQFASDYLRLLKIYLKKKCR